MILVLVEILNLKLSSGLFMERFENELILGSETAVLT